jgi:hypothetical protein
MFLWIALIAATVLMATCVTSSARSVTLASADTLRLGIAYGSSLVYMPEAELEARLDDAADMGAKWVRTDLSWNDIQPESASTYRWGRFDRVVDAVQKRGLVLLPIITYTPAWARPDGCLTEKCRPENADQFAKFAGEAAKRYPRISVWEIWNEENYPPFWKPQPDPAAYGELLKLSVASIRESNPAAKIIIGGLANTNAAQGGIAPRDFLADLVSAGETEGVNGIGLHPYNFPQLPSESGPWIYSGVDGVSGLQSLRDVFTAAGLPALPIWITEFGAPTGGGTAGDHVTEDRQAEMVADAVTAARADDGIAALFWYTYRDSGADPIDPESHYGLRRADGSPKPAYDAFRQVIAGSPR